MNRVVSMAAALVLGLIACCMGGLAAGTGVLTTHTCLLPHTTATPTPAAATDGGYGPWDAQQVAHAATIVAVGRQLGVPPRGWVVAVATAMQESSLRNLPHLGEANDHDSLGLFQQRPSQGWGSSEQLQDPQYAATAFYQRLVTVDGWEHMALTDAAQAVQRSAHPNAYAKWETDAVALTAAIVGTTTEALALCGAGGWVRPVDGILVSGFRTTSRPTHNGVDIAAPRGTTVVAAHTGTVTVATCNVIPTSWGCDRDGTPEILGCGWYVDIAHPGGITTRYCHLLSEPQVAVGDLVQTGQPIGQIGSSGRSSGPHLHYEVHLPDQGPVDPAPFMDSVGAPLG